MTAPSVEVVIFTYNHEKFIGAALDSVFAQEGDFELTIRLHDDCSTDETSQIAKKRLEGSGRRFQFFAADSNQYQFGSIFRWDFITRGEGDFIAFLDGDDLWTSPHKIQSQLDLLITDSRLALCHHLFSGLRENSNIPFYPPKKFRKTVLPGNSLADHNFIGTSTVLLRRSALPKTLPPGYNECRGVDDYPLWALATDLGRIGFIETDMTLYRLHESQHYATQPPDTKARQLLRALVYISNSVDPISQPIWQDALVRHVERQMTLNVLPAPIRGLARRVFRKVRTSL